MLGSSRRCLPSFSRKLSTSITATRISSSPSSFHRAALASSRKSIPLWSSRTFYSSPGRSQNAAVEQEVEDEVNGQRPPSDKQIDEAVASGPITKFQELATRNLVHENVLRAVIDQMGLETMTPVQTLTIDEGLKGTDIIAQAKTGTGKTLGFLLPILQNIIRVDPHLASPRTRGSYGNRSNASDIRAVIISPTRELAEQIAVEARKLTRNTSVIVQTAVGGTLKGQALQAMQRQGCHLLVGTPGRLNDIFSDPYSGVQAPKLSALVLDEADRLLDAGFWPEINNFQRLLPDPSEHPRQTLMFSATVPKEVVQLVEQTMRPGFQFVQTVSEDEVPTVERVEQHVVAVKGFENLLPTLLELAERETNRRKKSEETPFKALVYFNSTAEVDLAIQTIHQLGDRGSHPLQPAVFLDIHARKTQAQRTSAAEAFRRTPSAILFSSDVTARGMDFPNVTHVIQVATPKDREAYIHRIGRTGRAGKEGEGWLLVTEMELAAASSKLRGLPIQQNDNLETAKIDMTRDAQVSPAVGRILSMVGTASQRVDWVTKAKAYMGLLGNYGWFSNKQRLLDAMNQWTKYGWGWEKPPPIRPRLAHQLGLSRLQGVVIGDDVSSQSLGRDRTGGGGFERGGFGRGGFGRSGPPSSRGGSRDGGFGSGGRPERTFGSFEPRNQERPSRGESSGRGGFGERSGRGGFDRPRTSRPPF